ncbi:MAG: biopolymer transporter ExbD [Spirochaetes bacterium]|nr:biopolymer transporter ExbD [Spirochaetota bacterium]
MAASQKQNGQGPISDINVTPLVDIMLVLVIILMVTAEFTRYKTIPVNLPKVNAAAVKNEPHRVTVTIRKTGDIFVQDKASTSLDNLFEQIKSAKATWPDLAVIVRAEGDHPYKKVLTVLDKIKAAGASKVGLAVEAEKTY